jgi:uncharacterized protein Yka (UPF0111/DUF47 family)
VVADAGVYDAVVFAGAVFNQRWLPEVRSSSSATLTRSPPDPCGCSALAHSATPGPSSVRLGALRAAFVTPLEPEDVFALSRGIDWILHYARDLVSEAEVLACPPDAAIAEMARLLGEAAREIDRALAHLGSDDNAATDAADAAIKAERTLERSYYQSMGVLRGVEDRHERIARRELYRRCLRIGETVIDVAERVVYAVVKQS